MQLPCSLNILGEFYPTDNTFNLRAHFRKKIKQENTFSVFFLHHIDLCACVCVTLE
jgi:hypothetical protein